jgi:opacity protein-like surface antigen
MGAAGFSSGDINGITLSTNITSGTGSDSSFSYGAGAQYLFDRNWYAQAEYVSLYDKDDVTIKGPAIGVGYRF